MKLVNFILPKHGIIKARDAINIVEIRSNDPKQIEIIGSVRVGSLENKTNCADRFISLKFIFKGTVMYKLYKDNIRGLLREEEFEMYAESTADSTIMEIADSYLAKENKKIHGSENLHHIVLEAYDFCIESLCENLIVEEVVISEAAPE